MPRKSHFERGLEKKTEQAREDKARWAKDYPTKQPGENVKGKGWKSYSYQRHSSEAYREGYGRIDWSG